MPDSNLATVILAGWSDNYSCIADLHRDLEAVHAELNRYHQTLGVFHFPFDYNKQKGELGTYAKFDITKQRFYDFLNDNGLLAENVTLNIVGYSQGAMIALYAAGEYEAIRNRIHKYVSIASPHNSANFLQLLNLFNFLFFPIPLILTKAGATGELVNKPGQFLKHKYPAAAERVFSEIPRENMLQICSGTDSVAYPVSCERFSAYMRTEKVNGGHLGVAKQEKVRQMTLDFLFPELRLRATPDSALPGARIAVDLAAYPFTKVFPLRVGETVVQADLEDGKLCFDLPDMAPAATYIRGDDPESQLLPANFVIEPYIQHIEPIRGTTGTQVTLSGRFPATDNELYFMGSPVPATFDRKTVTFTVPPMPSGMHAIHVRHDHRRVSNPVKFILCDLIGNRNTKEVHMPDCPWIGHMKDENKMFLSSELGEPSRMKLDNCHWCHERHPETIGVSLR